jgi:ABC-2 type transport system ATP-binding protein
MSDSIVRVKDLKKTYVGFTAVDGVSFEVKKGEIFGLLGPNGAGKTTTLECLEGLRIPSSGEIDIMGINPTKNPKKLKDIIGVQLQASGLPESITVREAMELFCAYHGISPRLDLLERFNLKSKMSAQFSKLSGGQQRRLVLALAVAHNPALLILDEPTAALDVQSRAELHEIMRELKESGTTIILATHDMAEAEKLSDRIAILLKGKIVTLGTPKEITAAGSALTKVSVRTSSGCLKETENKFKDTSNFAFNEDYYIYYTSEPGRLVSQIIDYINSQSDSLIDLRVERPSLEERFLEITGVGGTR